ncbi:helix-turn-helix domain-containing protein [Streptomyces sp. NPDC003435]
MDAGAGAGVDADSDEEFLRCFGRQVKLFRELAGLTRAKLGERVGYGEAQIASVEQGRRIPRPELVDAIDRETGARGVLMAMKGEVAKARYPSFFRRYAQLEAEAEELHSYSNHVVKGILQTEEYARAVFRMWRPLGGPAVLRGQLEQLLLYGRERHIEMQVMPTQRDEHAGLAGPFTLIHLPDQRRMAYMEVQDTSALYSDPRKVSPLESTYGVLRAQALTPAESMAFIEKLLGEL